MSYPGNPSLPAETRERVRNTFEQTLELAAVGNCQEATLGCDFVLRLDPQFEPARVLLTRLQDGQGAVKIDDLQDGGGAPAAVPAPGGKLAGELQALFDERRFRELLAQATEARDQVVADPVLRGLVEAAQAKQEAEPYIQGFLESARKALREGDGERAARLLESARELDTDHPAVHDLETLLQASGLVPTAAPPLAAAPADELDFGEAPSRAPRAAIGGGDGRIRELLEEGRSAFERAEYQDAIDAWSRIFLIDIDHQEAAQRIEEARRLKAEQERQVEELFHDAMGKLDAGQRAEAKTLLERVLKLQPGHLAAREYLENMDRGPAAELPPLPTGAAAPAWQGEPLGDEVLQEEILVPPDPGGVRPTGAAARPAVPRAAAGSAVRGLSRRFMVIGGVALVAVIAVMWLLLQGWDRFFPNATEEGPVRVSAEVALQRAQELQQQGSTEEALAVLRRVPRESPFYDQAQALVSQWEAQADSTVQRKLEQASAEEQAAHATRARQIEAARGYLDQGEAYLAKKALAAAAQSAPLAGAEAELMARVEEELAPLSQPMARVTGGDYEFALGELWRLSRQVPEDRNVRRMLIEVYHNLGIRDLQRGDTESAAGNFDEAAKLDPADEELRRHLAFARTYQRREKDLLYDIYVRKLSFR
jgi:tetratricopeptide (TPR) repeat protein